MSATNKKEQIGADVYKLSPQKGDLLVVRCPREATPEARRAITEVMSTTLETWGLKDVGVLVVSSNVDIGLVRGEEAKALLESIQTDKDLE